MIRLGECLESLGEVSFAGDEPLLEVRRKYGVPQFLTRLILHLRQLSNSAK